MRLPFNRLALVTSAVICLFLGNGCRLGMNGGESAWKRPDLGKMAFWKKEESSVPKPPAVHFDPTPAHPENRLAEADRPDSNAAGLRDSIDKLADYENSAPANPVDELAGMAEKLNNPIRPPYQMSEPAVKNPAEMASSQPTPSSSFPTNGKDLVSTPAPLNAQFDMRGPSSDKTAESSRMEFLSAMQGVQPSQPPSGRSPENSTPNEFQFVLPNADLPRAVNPNVSVNQPLNGSAEEQRQLQTQIENAQREIAELKAQLASSNQQRLQPIDSNPGNNPGSDRAGDFGAPIANELQENRFASASPNSGALFSPPASPSTNGSTFAPLKPNSALGSPIANSPDNYPSTSHSQFAPPPTEELKTAREFVDPTVRPAGLQAPATTSAMGRSPLNKLDSASDIDIPDNVLKGKGTYAPGSVNRLRN